MRAGITAVSLQEWQHRPLATGQALFPNLSLLPLQITHVFRFGIVTSCIAFSSSSLRCFADGLSVRKIARRRGVETSHKPTGVFVAGRRAPSGGQ